MIFIAFACPYVLTVPVTNVSGVPTTILQEYKGEKEGLFYTGLKSIEFIAVQGKSVSPEELIVLQLCKFLLSIAFSIHYNEAPPFLFLK